VLALPFKALDDGSGRPLDRRRRRPKDCDSSFCQDLFLPYFLTVSDDLFQVAGVRPITFGNSYLCQSAMATKIVDCLHVAGAAPRTALAC
jgi:hypothetical protein